MDVLLLRFDAPLMSFGGPSVDNIGPTDPMPGRSMLTGLIANALGYTHRMTVELSRLQARIRHGVRRDRTGHGLADFQTVDLGQSFLVDTGWTTWGFPEKRAGANSIGTHIRHRRYHADAVFTVALSLEPASEKPTLSGVETALRAPARPLYLGRKPCLPSSPIVLDRIEASSLRDALRVAPRLEEGREDAGPLTAWWPDEGEETADSRRVVVHDERDWAQAIHAGSRTVRHGQIELPAREERR